MLDSTDPTGLGLDAATLVLRLDGFEGPLDLLLDLARAQKVDLARISILALVEQFLAVIEGARQVRLELAADWLVMAAWLAWLKSRLLLPATPEDEEDAELAAGQLAERLAQLQAVRAAAAWLDERPRLGRDLFARGLPDTLTKIDRSRLLLTPPALARAYLAAASRAAGRRSYAPRGVTFWSVQDALERVAALLGTAPAWTALEAFLPAHLPKHGHDPLHRKAAMASTLLAGLELARSGGARLRQDAPFGTILLCTPGPPVAQGQA